MSQHDEGLEKLAVRWEQRGKEAGICEYSLCECAAELRAALRTSRETGAVEVEGPSSREAFEAGYHMGYFDGGKQRGRRIDYEQWIEEVWDRRNDDDGEPESATPPSIEEEAEAAFDWEGDSRPGDST